MSDGGNQSLFTQFTLGERKLRNRIVMAPMTVAGLATLASSRQISTSNITGSVPRLG
jgi:2,4-dienoyl-CoA reductase-like NADH-dependent reductase (Old Yellow Enzyme family)